MIGGLGIPLSVKGLSYFGGNNMIPLPAGTAFTVPAGKWTIETGPYSFIQFLDPITQLWRTAAQQTPDSSELVVSDGANVRVANLTGCVIGAVVTTAGSGYTSNPVVTASAGGAGLRAIVGGAVNTSVTLPAFKGANYTYPPLVVMTPPPTGGLPASGKAVISGGALTGITITNQGAGYLTAPSFTFISDPKDPNNPLTFPATANPINPILSATATLTGAGTVVAVVVTDPGLPQTATPTIAFSGGGGASAAATALMNYTLTTFSVVAGGAVYGNAQPFFLSGYSNAISTATPIYTNPAFEKGITQPRMPVISGTSSAGGAIQTTGAVIIDAGLGLQASGGNMAVSAAGNALPTTIAQATGTVGGTDDYIVLTPMDS